MSWMVCNYDPQTLDQVHVLQDHNHNYNSSTISTDASIVIWDVYMMYVEKIDRGDSHIHVPINNTSTQLHVGT